MDFKSTIDLIIKDLNEATEIIDDLKKYPGVPALQVEFAKSKCKSAAEVIALLKNLDEILPARNQEQKPIAIPEPEKKSDIQEQKPVEVKKKSIIIPDTEIKPEQKKPKEKVSETSLADKFAPRADLYEDKLNIKAEKDLSDRLKRKPITNLSDEIGLNDRFLFISEIFGGDKDSYSQAISRLDKAENLSDAMAIIMSYTGEKPENEAVIQLLDLVRLKLPADE